MLAIRLSDEIESRLTRWRSKPAEQRRFMRKQYWRIWKDPEDYYLSAETAARVRRGDEAVFVPKT